MLSYINYLKGLTSVKTDSISHGKIHDIICNIEFVYLINWEIGLEWFKEKGEQKS